ncbi:MAG: AAA domain-containing protein [Nitrospira sp.]
MSIQRNAQDLFEYIAEVYSIDLPVIRDVLGYGDGRWWQAELVSSRFCKTKCFDDESDTPVGPEDTGGAWLSVLKSACDPPPPLPESLLDWVQLSPNPSKRPSPRPKISKRHRFDDDPARLSLYDEYRKAWINWEKQREKQRPGIPDPLKDWLDLSLGESNLPTPIQEQEREERFEDDQNRQVLLDAYLTTQWPLWADRTLPAYRANELYDQLFSLHQRLSVEGDRWEILWGHLFLNWQHSPGQAIYHPLLLTPIFLEFNPEKRNITLTPSQPTKFDFECLRDLEYNYKDTLLSLARRINESEEPSNPWSHNTVRGLSATVSGYLSSTAESETNLYSDKPVSKPLPSPKPTISNAPIIFVRERVRHFWIEDARKVAAAIAGGAQIPPFIHAAVSDPGKDNALSLALGLPLDGNHDVEEEDSELYFPLLHNDQQKEIWERLRHQFGVLVQGPPGTGKSHTIANIICDQLARGKKILVTSQTENALRVLRGHIPTAIRSLCVSQLGNDTESKKQLHEAVMEIGQHLAEKGSQARQQRIQNLQKGLRVIREEQACLQNQIRDWAKLDSEVIQLGEEKLTAHQAAKACSLGQERHGWLPDKLSPETIPPLNDHELRELCQTLRDLSPEDRKSCQLPLPVLESLPPPQKIREILSELRTSKALVDETEPLRRDWSEQLASASHSELSEAVAVVEAALTSLQQISEDWQSRILDLMASEDSQQSFWSNFISACSELREKAFRCFERIQGYQIEGLSLLDAETDWADALEELARVVSRGGNPGKLFTQLSLSKQAKTLFQTVVVDAKPLSTKERIDVVAFRLEYVSHIRKLETRWLQTARIVEGPRRDQQAPMALADIDARLRKVRDAVEWACSQMGTLKERLTALGCPKSRQVFHREATLLEHLKCLQGQIAAKRAHDLVLELNHFSTCADELSRNASCGSTLLRLAEAVRHHSSEEYESHYAELLRLYDVRVKVQRLEELLNRLQSRAPKWASEIERKAQLAGPDAISPDWQEAWRWQRLTQWLSHLHSRESVEDLQAKAEKLRNKEHEHITELVIERTWQRQLEKVRDEHYMALAAWAAAMKNYGKGTGKFAGRFLAAAARAMIDAVKAVPVWIMPLYRVVQSFHAEPELFDLVIIDEASQCDIRALPVLFRARQVLIVGDPEQISPTNVGVEREKVFELIRIRLAQLPHPERFIIDNSLFEITQTIPGMTRTMLTEHFRCVPEIIEFNNNLCPTYAGRLEPLRQTSPHERLEPPIITSFVPSGFKNDSDVNQPEAEALVEALVLSCQCEKYTGKTMGVISLLGENQAKYISDLIARKLDERECSQRRIICGDAYAFQGDERDVMFLSLVVAPNASFAPLVRNDARQRFNVATSRAKDQVFLFHSIRIEDVKNENCVRYKLLKWYQNPPLAEIEAGIEILRQKADSPFEIEVGTAIIKRGFKVIPQFRPFPRDLQYRIDLLVQGTRGRLAVECDGDQWHGPERWEYDQRRETQLRRAGLNFWRINGSTFYRDKDKALDSLWPAIERHCTGQ